MIVPTILTRKKLFVHAIAVWGTVVVQAAGVYPNEAVVPVDKKLSPEWVASLTDRGQLTTVSSGPGLSHVGMPVGGLFCGTVYLGGDGKLWLWDVFNDNRQGIMPRSLVWNGARIRSRDGASYVHPDSAQPSPFRKGFPEELQKSAKSGDDEFSGQEQMEQGFAIKVGDHVRTMDRNGWNRVAFTGTYPIGTVDYSDQNFPVSVRLEAFSPFIPLNTDDSSLPCTVMSFTIRNCTDSTVNGTIGGWLKNAVCCNSGTGLGMRVNKADPNGGMPHVLMTAEEGEWVAVPGREDVSFEDFEREDYAGWKVEGTAFDKTPLDNARIPPYMGDIGMHGSRAAVSHNVRTGGDVMAGDSHTGSLLSPEFTIDREFIRFSIAGGRKPGREKEGGTGIELLVDGKAVCSATGHNSNRLRPDAFPVKDYIGKKARLRIYDGAQGSWGNIIVDHIVFSDSPAPPARPLKEEADFGSFCFALASPGKGTRAMTSLPARNTEQALFGMDGSQPSVGNVRFDKDKPLGGLTRDFSIPAGESVQVDFILAWYFPNIYLNTMGDTGRSDTDGKKGRRHYAARFSNANDVASYVADHWKSLVGGTKLWRDTWYDSSLPFWFLDRTFANTSTLATTTSHRLTNGRFYAWEGVGACEGTCTHVWQYAQAPARLFPDIERVTRDRVDLGIGFHPETGGIGMRAEHNRQPAIDGQCGRIMGIWREHTMSADDSFLNKVWPRAKKAVQYVLDHDRDGDGILDGAQENTLDAAWYGEIAWTSIEALGAFKAGEEMALAVGDGEFAKLCRDRREKGRKAVEARLFNGKWFIQKKDEAHPNVFGTYNGSFIDQLFGQSMAYQCGLGELISPDRQKKALRSIWDNNFSPDLTEYLKHVRPLGRPYYVEGEGGTLMCTNALNESDPYKGSSWTHGYLNECMSGFEHQLASHMMRAGMVKEALAVTRAIHDRYSAEKRNPYNEIECSDHYARAMASYGTFLSACGYDYNGPEGKLGFNPRMSPENFKAAFTTAEGWGTYSQEKQGNAWMAGVTLKYGQLTIRELKLAFPLKKVRVTVDGKPAPDFKVEKGVLVWGTPLTLKAGQTLTVQTGA